MAIPVVRSESPRLFRAPDDPEFLFPAAADSTRVAIRDQLLADCESFTEQQPWPRLAERLDSPHPFHQLYITFYSAMHATALIETYAFAWRLTADERWLERARVWLEGMSMGK